MPTLDDSVTIGELELPNRLYRAPLLECAGNGPDAVDALVDELEPAAASGVGLIFQGASIVSAESGCAAPNMTRVHDPGFVARLSRLTEAVHEHGGRIFVQLAHGGLRSLETWHVGYRERHPDFEQLAVSCPPAFLRLLDRAGLLDLRPRVMSTDDVYDLADEFGRAAGYAVDAGYDGIHLSGANMGIVQQFLSPYYNRREDEFADGVRFLAAIRDAVREQAGDVPLVTKVPAETASPWFVRRHLSWDDAVEISRRLADGGYDAVVPVEVSTFWDTSIIRGEYPRRAWASSDLEPGYASAFGSRRKAGLVALLNRIQARRFGREPGWNAALCRRVRDVVDVPVLCEGGVRRRAHADRLLGEACDLVGMGRPFYAEPRLGARLLDEDLARDVGDRAAEDVERTSVDGGEEEEKEEEAGGVEALCRSCNNCTVPQVTGADGRCRTPSVVRERTRLESEGAYGESEREK